MFFAITVMMSLSVTAMAQSEVEPNNSIANATKLSFNSTVYGKTDIFDHYDYYRVSPSKNGALTINFNHTYISGNSGHWYVSVMTLDGTRYRTIAQKTIYANENYSSNVLSYFGAKAGKTYYIDVFGNSNVNGVNYSITNSYLASENFEKEFNDSFTTATKIPLYSTMKGKTTYGDYVDCYKIQAPTNGYLRMNFNYAHQNTESYYTVSVYVYQDNDYKELHLKRVYVTGDGVYKIPGVGTKQGKTYYIKIYGNYSDLNNKSYSIYVNFVKSNNYEKEFNNTQQTASNIQIGSTITGTFTSLDYYDWYKIVPTKTENIKISFKHPYVKSDECYYITVYEPTSTGKLKTIDYQKIYLNNSSLYNLSVYAKKGKTYYILLTKSGYEKIIGVDYNISVSKK